MFLELGRVDSKVNRESRRIYNISGMPDGNGLIYSGCNRFPVFPIRTDGDRVSLGGAAEFRDPGASSCKLIKPHNDRTSTYTGSLGFGVQAIDRTHETPGLLGRRRPMHAGMHPDAADDFAAGREIRSVSVIDYDED